MAFDFSIKAFFGGDVSGLKKATAEAMQEVDKLNQRMGGRAMHHLVGGFIGFEALRTVKEWAGEAIKQAQETRDKLEELHRPVDNATASLARFGDGLKDVKGLAVDAVGFLVGGFTQIGDLIGSGINRLRGISEAEENINERSNRETDAFLNEMEERRKKTPQIIAEREKKAAEEAFKEREKYYREEQEREKHKADETMKALEGHKRLEERRAEASREQMSDEDRLLALQKEELRLKTEMQGRDEYDSLYLEDGNKLLDIQREIRATNLRLTKEEAKAEETVAEKMQKQADALLSILGIRTSLQFGNSSDDELREAARRDRETEEKLKRLAIGANAFPGGGLAYSMESGRAGAERVNIEQELALREKTRNDIRMYGLDRARQSWQGDPLAFDRFVQQLAQGMDTNDRMLVQLEKIHNTLSGKFRNQ